MAINPIQALQNSPYLPLAAEPRDFGDRLIYKFICNHNGDRVRIAEAANAVLNLRNADYCCTFQTEPQQVLEDLIAQNVHLTVNGLSISLATERDAPENTPDIVKDLFFSETLINNPVRCPLNHVFEQGRAVIWAGSRHNMCPAGGNHHIGNLLIAPDLVDNVQQFRNLRGRIQRQNQEQAAAHTNEQVQLANNRINEIQNNAVQDIKTFNTVMGAGVGAGKIVGKVATVVVVDIAVKQVVKQVTKQFGKQVAKTAAKTIWKTIPFFGILPSIACAAARIWKGQYVKALGEIASGAACFIPVVGIFVTVGMDAAMALHDISQEEAVRPADIPADRQQLNAACAGLGINPAALPNLTQQQVVAHYHEQMRNLHPDPANPHGEYIRGQFNEAAQDLNRLRDIILQHKGWA